MSADLSCDHLGLTDGEVSGFCVPELLFGVQGRSTLRMANKTGERVLVYGAGAGKGCVGTEANSRLIEDDVIRYSHKSRLSLLEQIGISKKAAE